MPYRRQAHGREDRSSVEGGACERRAHLGVERARRTERDEDLEAPEQKVARGAALQETRSAELLSKLTERAGRVETWRRRMREGQSLKCTALSCRSGAQVCQNLMAGAR